jgi:hypothetical protein
MPPRNNPTARGVLSLARRAGCPRAGPPARAAKAAAGAAAEKRPAGLTIDRKYEEPWSGQLPTRIMVLTNELPRSTDASGATSSRFISGACGWPTPEQMARVPEFLGDGEATSL